MVLSDFCSVEHSVERCNLVYLHGCHLQNLGDFIHRRESQEVVVLLLSDEESRYNGGRFVVVGVLFHQYLNSVEAGLSKLERS